VSGSASPSRGAMDGSRVEADIISGSPCSYSAPAIDSKSERGTTGGTQGLGRIRRRGSHNTGLWAPSMRAPAAMRWSVGAAGATLARDCERDGGSGGSEGRGRSGRRQSRRQWAGRFSSQRTRSDREGRCERDQAGSESTTRIPPYCVLWQSQPPLGSLHALGMFRAAGINSMRPLLVTSTSSVISTRIDTQRSTAASASNGSSTWDVDSAIAGTICTVKPESGVRTQTAGMTISDHSAGRASIRARRASSSGFSVDNSVRILDRKAQINLAEYISRLPMSLKKIHYEPFKGRVLFHTKYADYFKENIHMFDALDFLAELTQQIPPKGTQLIRRYGLYAETLDVSAGSSAQRGTSLIIGPRGDGKRWTISPNGLRWDGGASTS